MYKDIETKEIEKTKLPSSILFVEKTVKDGKKLIEFSLDDKFRDQLSDNPEKYSEIYDTVFNISENEFNSYSKKEKEWLYLISNAETPIVLSKEGETGMKENLEGTVEYIGDYVKDNIRMLISDDPSKYGCTKLE